MLTFARPRPEQGTEDEVVVARIAAFLIDMVGFWVVFGGLANLIYLVSEGLGIAINLLAVPLFFLYFIYFEAEYGQTIGKMLLDIVVVTDDGGPLSYTDATVRTLLRLVDALPFFYVVGLVAIYVTDRNQRVGDLVADTVVVRAVEKGEKL